MPKDDRVAKARKQLTIATKQCDAAHITSWEPADPAECVSKCFYAFENAVVAAAMALDITWKRDHKQKADVAALLFNEGKLENNIHELLVDLNSLRKDISYDEPGPILEEMDLEDLLSDLEDYLSQVESLINEVEVSD